MSSPDRIARFEELRSVAAGLAQAVTAASQEPVAAALAAVAEVGNSPEDLLELRSTLISTRTVWEDAADEELARRASKALGDAKRLAIELD